MVAAHSNVFPGICRRLFAVRVDGPGLRVPGLQVSRVPLLLLRQAERFILSHVRADLGIGDPAHEPRQILSLQGPQPNTLSENHMAIVPYMIPH